MPLTRRCSRQANVAASSLSLKNAYPADVAVACTLPLPPPLPLPPSPPLPSPPLAHGRGRPTRAGRRRRRCRGGRRVAQRCEARSLRGSYEVGGWAGPGARGSSTNGMPALVDDSERPAAMVVPGAHVVSREARRDLAMAPSPTVQPKDRKIATRRSSSPLEHGPRSEAAHGVLVQLF